jgi:hypothetical protein
MMKIIPAEMSDSGDGHLAMIIAEADAHGGPRAVLVAKRERLLLFLRTFIAAHAKDDNVTLAVG